MNYFFYTVFETAGFRNDILGGHKCDDGNFCLAVFFGNRCGINRQICHKVSASQRRERRRIGAKQPAKLVAVRFIRCVVYRSMSITSVRFGKQCFVHTVENSIVYTTAAGKRRKKRVYVGAQEIFVFESIVPEQLMFFVTTRIGNKAIVLFVITVT